MPFFQEIMIDPMKDRKREINSINKNIPSLVTQEKNNLLMNPITLVEVEEVVDKMFEGKLPKT